MPSKSKSSFNETLSSLLEPTPVDFDPEAPDTFDDADENRTDESEDENTKYDPKLAREHYVSVGKSKLRMGQDVENLGPQYKGARVSRDALEAESDDDEEDAEDESDEEMQDGEGSEGETGDEEDGGVEVWGEDEDIDSDEAFSSGDEARFKDFKFKGSRTTEEGVVPEKGHKVTASSDEEDPSDANSDDDDDESSNPDQTDASSGENTDAEEEEEDDSEAEARRNAMTKLLQKEETTVKKSLTAAQQAEQSKGRAIQHQQKAYDRLLSARIKFQPVLQTVNTLSVDAPQEQLDAAYAEALGVFNTIFTLRAKTLKRKFEAVEHSADDSLETVYATMSGLTNAGAGTINTTLEKWAEKTAPVSASAGDTLAKTAPKSITAGITTLLTTDLPRLLSRTQIPRACAPGNTKDTDPEIFDDTDFYGQLLRALVDARAGNEVIGQAALEVRETKKRRKEVDTKASKGRKLRYHVHEKLVGFVAPVEGWERWREEQRRELFMGLLGQRRAEDDEDDEDEGDKEEEEEIQDTGLRLFG